MKVANTLATFFIDANLKVRESQAIGTSSFLEAELETMRDRLESVEQNLKDYRVKHTGELPEQLEANLRIIDRFQTQMGQGIESLRNAKFRLQVLQAQAAQNERNQTVTTGGQARAGEPEQLENLKNQLRDLETRYTPLHPDVVRLKSMIAKLETQPDQKEDGKPEDVVQTEISASIPGQGQNEPLQVTELKNEITRLEKQLKSIDEQLIIYQKRVAAVPHREQELLSLRRDYDNINNSYSSLLARKFEAEMAVNMEKKQKGEQFYIIDSARFPTKPIEPNMKKLFLMVIVSGLGIGAGLIFLVEYLNKSFKFTEEIEEYLGLPVMAVIPVLVTPKAERMRKINIVMSLFGVAVIGCLIIAVAALSFLPDKESIEIISKVSTTFSKFFKGV